MNLDCVWKSESSRHVGVSVISSTFHSTKLLTNGFENEVTLRNITPPEIFFKFVVLEKIDNNSSRALRVYPEIIDLVAVWACIIG